MLAKGLWLYNGTVVRGALAVKRAPVVRGALPELRALAIERAPIVRGALAVHAGPGCIRGSGCTRGSSYISSVRCEQVSL